MRQRCGPAAALWIGRGARTAFSVGPLIRQAGPLMRQAGPAAALWRGREAHRLFRGRGGGPPAPLPPPRAGAVVDEEAVLSLGSLGSLGRLVIGSLGH